jgi:hypothetical protein
MSQTLQTHPLLIDTRADYLDGWRWMVGDDAVLLAASLSGDLFFRDHDGRVHWIDTGAGCIECIADDVASFQRKVHSAEFCSNYLLESVITDELRIHGQLGPGRCFGYRKLPVFGGDYSGENRVPIRAAEHFAFTGDVHQQIDGLPDGASIELVVR